MRTLTERKTNGTWQIRNFSWERFKELDITESERMTLYAVFTKLKDYEMSGLSPDTVQSIAYEIKEGLK